MEIIKYKKKNSNEYIITLSDNTSLSFYDDTIIYYNLLAKKNIDNKFLEEIIAYNNKYKGYYESIKYIKTKLRTEKEIVAKLKQHKHTNDNIEFIVGRLKGQGYINDDLYIKSYINDSVNLSLKGPGRIINELKKLGFNEEHYIKYINEYPEEIWIERVRTIIDKKKKSNHKLSLILFKNKTKQDLIHLGYDINKINELIDSIEFNEDNNLKNVFNKELMKLQKKHSNDELKYKLRNNLYKKGFSLEKINELINNIE